MNAFEFVKEKGIDGAKAFLDLHEYTIDQLMMLQAVLRCVDLKRIVESHEIVGAYGGLDGAKKKLSKLCILRWITPEITELEQAISDVEACQ